jgi:hypothetical protein
MRQADMMKYSLAASHVAYADESNYCQPGHRGVGIVTATVPMAAELAEDVRSILSNHGVAEFKWEKCRTRRYRSLAVELVDLIIDRCMLQVMRVDVVAWHDSDLTEILDDRPYTALEKMYLDLLKQVLRDRWGDEVQGWDIHIDEGIEIDWRFLTDVRNGIRAERRQYSLTFPQDLERRYRVESIVTSPSADCPLIQLADLMTGLVVYARNAWGRYLNWRSLKDQYSTDDEREWRSALGATNSEFIRSFVIDHFIERANEVKLGIFEREYGLETPVRSRPIAIRRPLSLQGK